MAIGHWWAIVVVLVTLLLAGAFIVAIIVIANLISHRLLERDRRHPK